jgi:hypothetical protein
MKKKLAEIEKKKKLDHLKKADFNDKKVFLNFSKVDFFEK